MAFPLLFCVAFSTLPLGHGNGSQAEPVPRVFPTLPSEFDLSSAPPAPARVEQVLLTRDHVAYLPSLYELPDPAAFRQILQEIPELAVLLVELGGRLVKVFGIDRLGLAVQLDHDSPSEPAEIVVKVPVAGALASAAEVLHRFDEEWWVDQTARALHRLTIVLDPV